MTLSPGITFAVAPPRLAPDPNRLDVTLVVGLLAERPGASAARERAVADLGPAWAGRAAAGLTDLPVRVRSIAEAEALFDLDGRLDRVARVRGQGLADPVEIAAADRRFVVNVDGEDIAIDLADGLSRLALRDALAARLTGVDVALADPDAQGRAGVILTRSAAGPGALTAYANPSLGFPVAARDACQAVPAPSGTALRQFFAAGGREAVVVAMGTPPAIFAPEDARIAALQTLLGYAGGATLADLGPPPALPAATAPMAAAHGWAHLSGLAHLHALPEVAMVLLPDLPEVLATVPATLPEPRQTRRPPERFTPCIPEPPIVIDGAMAPGAPATVAAGDLPTWRSIAGWAARETARISPEVMAILAAPLVEDGALGAIPTHPQLQVTGDWAISRLHAGLPGRAAPADGLIAGTIAARTLARGHWRSVAGSPLTHIQDLLPASPDAPLTEGAPLTRLIRTVRGIQIATDRTTDQVRYPQANVRRLMHLILRAARHRGESAAFEPNGQRLWRDVRMVLTTLLRRLHADGALRGEERDAFQVTCGPETMTQSDIDQGRVIAEISVAPAQSIEKIEITLHFQAAAPGSEAAA